MSEDRYFVPGETWLAVRRQTVKDLPDGHWSWKGPSLQDGYSVIYEDGSILMVHRIQWRRHRGRLPEGSHLTNICGEKWCVNPAHWIETTPGEHARRARSSLSWPVVRAMRQLHREEGWSAKRVASHFGRGVSQVKMILAGHRWPEEEDPERAEP